MLYTGIFRRKYKEQGYLFSFQVIHLCLALVVYFSVASALPNPQLSIKSAVPDDKADKEKPDLRCSPATWPEILLFYLGNYVTHATTVKPLPGEPRWDLLLRTYFALLYPQSTLKGGIKEVLRNFLEHKASSGNLPLSLAARANALCMVVRAPDWIPQEGDTVKNAVFVDPINRSKKQSQKGLPQLVTLAQQDYTKLQKNKPVNLITSLAPSRYALSNSNQMYSDLKTFVPKAHRIYGTCILPPGYKLAVVPANASISPRGHKDPEIINSSSSEVENSNTIATSYGFAKAFVSFIQALFSTLNIYMSKGGQISRYGYAAFGLTIIPFTLMSVVNLASNLRLPEHSSLYMVASDIMEEAIRHGGSFEGIVGELYNEDALPNMARGISGKFTRSEDSSGISLQLQHQSCVVPQDDLPRLHEPKNKLTTGFHSELEEIFSGLNSIGSDISTGGSSSAGAEDEDHAIRIQHVNIAEINRKVPRQQPSLVVPSFNSFKLQSKNNRQSIEAAGDSAPSLAELVHSPWMDALDSLFWSFLVTGVSLILTGSLTHFNKGHSTKAQRIWLILWQWVGAWFSPIVAQGQSLFGSWKDSQTEKSLPESRSSFELKLTLLQFAIVAIYSVPAIGGLVVVGQMLHQYGSCATVA